jgi:hypothetical protein
VDVNDLNDFGDVCMKKYMYPLILAWVAMYVQKNVPSSPWRKQRIQ